MAAQTDTELAYLLKSRAPDRRYYMDYIFVDCEDIHAIGTKHHEQVDRLFATIFMDDVYQNLLYWLFGTEPSHCIHEMYIGVRYFNTLRRYVPNFLYTYNTAIVGKTGQVLVVEHLPLDSKTLRQLYPSLQPEDMFVVMLQIVSALDIAGKELLRHNSLIADNIIVRVLPQERLIPLYTDPLRTTRAVNTRYVPQIGHYGECEVGCSMRRDLTTLLNDLARVEGPSSSFIRTLLASDSWCVEDLLQWYPQQASRVVCCDEPALYSFETLNGIRSEPVDLVVDNSAIEYAASRIDEVILSHWARRNINHAMTRYVELMLTEWLAVQASKTEVEKPVSKCLLRISYRALSCLLSMVREYDMHPSLHERLMDIRSRIPSNIFS
jgi:hypothetical protein